MKREDRDFVLPVIIIGSFAWAASVVAQLLRITQGVSLGWTLLVGAGLWICAGVLAYSVVKWISGSLDRR